LLALCTTTQAATYIVTPTGGGNGTLAAPWSLAQANAGLQPGDTAQLRAGNYDDLIQPASPGGTTEATRITYTNFPGDATPHVRGKAATLNGTTVKASRKKYLTVSNLNLSSDKTDDFTNVPNVDASSSDHFIVSNCELTHPLYLTDPRLADGLSSTTLPPWRNQIGISLNGSQFALVDGCTIVGWKDGISAGKSTHATIRNNVIQNNWDSATSYGNYTTTPIDVFLLIEGNHIGGCMTEDGFQTGSSAPGTIMASKIVIRNNFFYYNGEDALDFKAGGEILVEGNVFTGTSGDNDGYAFNADRAPNTTWQTVEHYSGGISRGSGTISSQVIIRKNVFYDNNYGVALNAGSTDWKCYNNTFASNNRDFPDGWNGTYDEGVAHKAGSGFSASGFAFINNISMDHMNCEVYRETSEAVGILNHNLYSNLTPNGLRFGQSPNSTINVNRPMSQQTIFAGPTAFADWKTYLNTQSTVEGREANSVLGSPQFVNVPAYPNLRFDYKRANPDLPTYLPVITMALRPTWFPYDFRLASASSPGVDAGTFPTPTTTAATGNTGPVADARYFTDGFGVVTADMVQIGTNVVQITAVNYTAQTLTITPAISWRSGDGVSLPYNGSKPDIGAFEFGGPASGSPPVVTAPPASTTAALGGGVTFAVTATGVTSQQWRKNGAPIPGAADATLTLNNLTASDAGNYDIVLTNASGATTSAAATLLLNDGLGSRLSNLSARTTLAANQILTVGLTIQGGAKPVLLRAAANAVGAFPFLADNSLDAALVRVIDGGRSVQVSGPAAGNVIVEAYDAGAGGPPRRTNLSALNLVGPGGNAGGRSASSRHASASSRSAGPRTTRRGGRSR
jgi:parallel beta-helix repeat protein